ALRVPDGFAERAQRLRQLGAQRADVVLVLGDPVERLHQRRQHPQRGMDPLQRWGGQRILPLRDEVYKFELVVDGFEGHQSAPSGSGGMSRPASASVECSVWMYARWRSHRDLSASNSTAFSCAARAAVAAACDAMVRLALEIIRAASNSPRAVLKAWFSARSAAICWRWSSIVARLIS